LPLDIRELVARVLLELSLQFIRFERGVFDDLPDGDCDDGGAVAKDSNHVSLPRRRNLFADRYDYSAHRGLLGIASGLA
jgi:hypothetical protein